MSLAFSASASTNSGNSLYNATVPSLAAFTEAFWVYLVSDLNRISAFTYRNDHISDSQWILVGTAADGVSLYLETAAGNASGSALSVGAWYHVCLVKSGSSYTVYLNGKADITRTDATSLSSINNFYIGGIWGSSVTNYGANMVMAGYQLFNSALNPQQVQRLTAQVMPDYRLGYPFHSALPMTFDTLAQNYIDLSGNNRNWSAGSAPSISTLAPPVPMVARPPFPYYFNAASGGNNYTETPSGGIVFGGFSLPSAAYSPGVSGGLVLGSVATPTVAYLEAPSGGLVLGGINAPAAAYSLVVSGGAVLGGYAPPAANSYTETPSGGLVLGGLYQAGYPIASDTFTDTAGTSLASHTPDTGGSWTLHSSYTGSAAISDANRVRSNSTAISVYYHSVSPPGADYPVSADIYALTLPTAPHGTGIVGRLDTASDTYYRARYNAQALEWQLHKVVSGVTTQLGSGYGQTISTSTPYRLTLQMSGTSISLLVDGVTRVGPITDSAISAAGKAGVHFTSNTSASTNTTGVHLDNFTAGTNSLYAANPSASGGAVLGGMYTGGTASYALTPSGGVVLGGVSAPSVAITVTASGGLVLGGSNVPSAAYAITPSGGLVLGGVSTPTATYTVTPSGGVVLGGTAPPSNNSYSESGSGGVVLGGMNAPTAAYVITASGGFVLGGTSTETASYSPTASGGAVLGAVVTPAANSYTESPSGGLVLGGAASPAMAFAPTISGGVVLGGTVSTAPVAYTITAAGGVVLGGSVTIVGLQYNIYWNSGSGPIDYSTPLATVSGLTYATAALSASSDYKFGVRAYSTTNGLEEKNLDAFVEIVLDASFVDVTTVPKAPAGLRAFALSGGSVRVEWTYPSVDHSTVTGFHVYSGTGGTPSYVTPVATVLETAGLWGTYGTTLTGLSDGTVYTIGVRSYNGTGEETNTATVNVTADSTAPSVVDSLAGVATAQEAI